MPQFKKLISLIGLNFKYMMHRFKPINILSSAQVLRKKYSKLKWIFATLTAIMIFSGCSFFKSSKISSCHETYFFHDTANLSNGSIKITFLGTSALLIDDGITQILTDPFFQDIVCYPLRSQKFLLTRQ